MKPLIIFIATILLQFNLIAQNFGCYDIDNILSKSSFLYQYSVIKEPYNQIDWSAFKLTNKIQDGYYNGGSLDISSGKDIKMKGWIKNGLQEGLWKFKIDNNTCYQGTFKQGKKAGNWFEYMILETGDSICYSKNQFKNDLLDGKSEFYFNNGKIYQTTEYLSGVKNGQEIIYFEIDTIKENYIKKLSEYSNDTLNGKFLFCIHPNDTNEYGTYVNGKRNGKFNFHLKDNYYIDFKDNQIHGKLTKISKKGIVLLELEYENNLPYSIIRQSNADDSLFQDKALKEGNGTLSTFYDNGKLMSRFEYKNQLIYGKFCIYDQNGKIKETGIIHAKKGSQNIFTSGDLENINILNLRQLQLTTGTNYVIYNDDGSIHNKLYSNTNDTGNQDIIIVDEFKNGKICKKSKMINQLYCGVQIMYYPNDSVEMQGNFAIINDSQNKPISVKDGLFSYYYINGRKRAEIKYSLGKEIGTSQYFDENGRIIRTKVINKDNSIYNTYNGDTVNRLDFAGRKQGKWISLPNLLYSENNCNIIPNEFKYYIDNHPAGIWESYSVDGKRLLEKTTWQDTVHAYCQRWNNIGILMEEGNLYNQQKSGEWKEYNGNGKLSAIGQYNYGQIDGVWLYYTKKGKLNKKLRFKNGEFIEKINLKKY